MKTEVITKTNLNNIVTAISRVIESDGLRTVFYTLSRLLELGEESKVQYLSLTGSLYIKIKGNKHLLRISNHKPRENFNGVCIHYNHNFEKVDRILSSLP